jgi:hypothetical protein
MKKLLPILLLFCSIAGFAQPGDDMVKNFVLDFTVPDQPAYNAIGGQPSNILKPASAQEFTAVISQFIDGKKFALPKSFGVEFSPYQMYATNRIVSLKEYEKLLWLKNTSLSLATSRGDSANAPTDVAIGVRINFLKNGDELNNADYLKGLYALLADDVYLRQKLVKQYRLDNDLKPGDLEESEWKRIGDSLMTLKPTRKDKLLSGDEAFNKALQALNEQYKQDHWNDPSIDFAAVCVVRAQDSTGKNTRFNKADLWLTLANGFKTKYLQLILGFHGSVLQKSAAQSDADSSKAKVNGLGTLSSRLYIGSNKYKGFVELQGGFKKVGDEKLKGSTLFNAGAEFTVLNFLWVTLNGGVNDFHLAKNGASPYFKFDWRFTIPQTLGINKPAKKS